jgi:hypothetical protein
MTAIHLERREPARNRLRFYNSAVSRTLLVRGQEDECEALEKQIVEARKLGEWHDPSRTPGMQPGCGEGRPWAEPEPRARPRRRRTGAK